MQDSEEFQLFNLLCPSDLLKQQKWKYPWMYIDTIISFGHLPCGSGMIFFFCINSNNTYYGKLPKGSECRISNWCIYCGNDPKLQYYANICVKKRGDLDVTVMWPECCTFVTNNGSQTLFQCQIANHCVVQETH